MNSTKQLSDQLQRQYPINRSTPLVTLKDVAYAHQYPEVAKFKIAGFRSKEYRLGNAMFGSPDIKAEVLHTRPHKGGSITKSQPQSSVAPSNDGHSPKIRSALADLSSSYALKASAGVKAELIDIKRFGADKDSRTNVHKHAKESSVRNAQATHMHSQAAKRYKKGSEKHDYHAGWATKHEAEARRSFDLTKTYEKAKAITKALPEAKARTKVLRKAKTKIKALHSKRK